MAEPTKSDSVVPQHGTQRPGRWCIAAIAALALIVRVAHLYYAVDAPFVKTPVGDAARYLEWAEEIAAGKWIANQPFYQAPLYPYLLAFVFLFAKPSVVTVLVVQSIGAAVATYWLGAATERWFGKPAGICAALMLALYGPTIFLDGIVQKESLAVFLVCGMLFSIGRADSSSVGWRICVGFAAGLLALTRENALIWLPIVCLWPITLRVLPWKVRVWRVAAVVGGACAALVPALLHNVLAGNQWAITTVQSGPNFYIGNHAGADGRYVPLVPGHETPEFERADATALAERAMGRTLSPKEVSRYWSSQAWADIAEAPGQWLKLLGKKLLMVCNEYEVSDAESVGVYGAFSPVLGVLAVVWHWGMLFPLAVGGGVAWGWRRPGGLLVTLTLTMAAAIVAFYILGRYRAPLVPLMIPPAAWFVVSAAQAIRERRVQGLVVPLLAVLAAGAVARAPVHDVRRLEASARMNAGVAFARSGDLPAAIRWFTVALDDFPESGEINANLAQALALLGHYQESLPYYEQAMKAQPTLPSLAYNYAVALEHTGDVAGAERAYRLALEMNHDDLGAKAALERLNGNPVEATSGG